MQSNHRNGMALALAGALAVGSSGAGGCSGETDEPTSASTASTGIGGGSSTESSSSGLPFECAVPDDCPTPDDCLMPTCSDGVCGTELVPAGMIGGNTPLGDCKQVLCDGSGNKELIANDEDLPNDGLECTTDTCNAGVPTHTPKPMNSVCGPSGSQFCHSTGQCKPCKELTAACEEIGPGEPTNDAQVAAHSFGTLSDADSDGKEVCAVLKGSVDVDWYTYKGVDEAFSVVDPFREVSSDLKTRLCVYLKCDAGTTSFNCPSGSTEDTAPLGQEGCCSEGALEMDFDCSGVSDDNASVWLKVENPDGLACVPYQISFHY